MKGLGLVVWAALATPALAQETKKGEESAEERIRRQLLEELTQRVRNQDRLISLDLEALVEKWKTAHEGKEPNQVQRFEVILDEFRKQIGISIDLDPRNINPDEPPLRVFKVTKVPFREALDALLAKADLVIADETAALIRIVRPARVSFNFPRAKLSDVIDMIARLSNANIIIAPDVLKIDPPVSVTVNNVPWNEVLNALVKSAGFLAVREKYEIVRVIDPKELLKQLETRAMRLKYIQPPPTYKAKIEDGKYISGKPVQPQQQLEQRLREFVLLNVLSTALTRDSAGKIVGSINFDWGTNTFFVQDTKPALDRIEEMIKLIDQEPEQVIIDLKFISTTNEDLLAFGMNYILGTDEGFTVRTRGLNPVSYTGPLTTTNSTAFSPFTEAFSGKVTRLPFGLGHEDPISSQFFLTEWNMTATMRAFRRDRYSKFIQEPTLAILDNHEATLFVGEEVHYAEIGSEATQFGTIINTIKEASRSPVKVGFQLYVMPKIVPETNKVLLTLIPVNEFLNGSGTAAGLLAGFERFEIQFGGATSRIDLPRIATTTVVTKILLESGRTAVLGGLVQERSSFEDKGVPILMDIPLLSYLFKQRNDKITKQHLLIFITPRIVRRGGAGNQESLQAQTKSREEELRRDMEALKRQKSREELERQEAERRKAEKEKFEKKTP